MVSESAGNGFTGAKHLALHFLRVHMDATYGEIVKWASETGRVNAVLQLARSAF
jgi:IS5 family transposase